VDGTDRVTEPAGESLFLVEAYRAPGKVDGIVADPAAADEDPALVGLIAIPNDEAVLCLVRAPSGDAASAIARVHGLTPIRSVPARWIGEGVPVIDAAVVAVAVPAKAPSDAGPVSASEAAAPPPG
jgi:hypothetical protein